MSNIEAVCFDAFGTLCRIGDRRRPYETLFARLGLVGQDARRLALTTNVGLRELADNLGKARAAEGLAESLESELNSVVLFDESVETLNLLTAAGIRVWVISNLAAPYGGRLRRLLDKHVNGFSLSYEVGAIKPESAIFSHACQGLSLPPSQDLMVGDSRRADVEGPAEFGMQSVWLRRGHSDNWPVSIGSLRELPHRVAFTNHCRVD